MFRIAATADVHFAEDARGSLRPHLDEAAREADVFLIAGDLTRHGTAEEASVLADELQSPPIPVVVVLGNHDYHADENDEIHKLVEQAGCIVLEGQSTRIDTDSGSLGIAGAKGFGGGFRGRSGSEFGEPEMKAFMRHSRELAGRLEEELIALGDCTKVALIHYSPAEETLEGEPPQIHPFLGSYLLADAVDNGGASVAFHGHAHVGSECGQTPRGVPVRNVSQQVLGAPYKLYRLDPENGLADA